MSTIIVPIIIPQNTAPSSYSESYLSNGTRIDVTFNTPSQSRADELSKAIQGAGFTITKSPDDEMPILAVPVVIAMALFVIVFVCWAFLTILGAVDWLGVESSYYGATYDKVNGIMKTIVRGALVLWPIITVLVIAGILFDRKKAG